MDSADTIRIKQTRRLLLTNLEQFYPTPVRLDTLFRTACIDPTYDFSLFTKDITYLHDKGYIHYIDDVLGGAVKFEHKVIKLTAEGKEIADRTRIDDALEI